ncbi:PBP superfamily domain protein [Clostridium magnum DSM 2767]|uniref:PBP superfamily domain protein n=1 Tax=Clostridium magnum DSM 2767 TaxID=1121326 RepID=A0A162S5T0_9CLOT|nr:PBP superfamily domain protein [Clostridium magnum DSM 2767]SHI11774.1 putative molybdopterin biosynthesis protein [Clostridium magnum DSM 2767]
MIEENSVLTPEEVADILKIAKNTVYELIKRGELNAYKVGKKFRIDLKDIEEYKNSSKRKKSSTSESRLNQNLSSAISNANILKSETISGSGLVICGQDSVLDILSRYLEVHPKGVRALRSYVGSYNGLYELYNGTAQIATAHLWDGDSGEYNIPYVRRMVPGVPTIIVHIACRMLGFYVAKGNPKKILSWEDLKRDDITIVNREKGSGTRILLDEHLRKIGVLGTQINGYERECISHLAAASTVARGGADLGIGNEMASLSVKDVDFIPIQKERFELVMKKEDMLKGPFQAILEILQSDGFKSELKGIGGYDLEETGKIVAEI